MKAIHESPPSFLTASATSPYRTLGQHGLTDGAQAAGRPHPPKKALPHSPPSVPQKQPSRLSAAHLASRPTRIPRVHGCADGDFRRGGLARLCRHIPTEHSSWIRRAFAPAARRRPLPAEQLLRPVGREVS